MSAPTVSRLISTITGAAGSSVISGSLTSVVSGVGVLVAIIYRSSVTINSVTLGGAPLSSAGARQLYSNDALEFYWLSAAAGGTQTHQVTFSGNLATGGCKIHSVEFGEEINVGSISSVGSPNPVNYTTTFDNAVVFGIFESTGTSGAAPAS